MLFLEEMKTKLGKVCLKSNPLTLQQRIGPQRTTTALSRLPNTTSRQRSLHEEPSSGRSDPLPAHGALPQLLAAVAVAADHVSAGHQDHGWATVAADGTHGGGGACLFAHLRALRSCITPICSQLCTESLTEGANSSEVKGSDCSRSVLNSETQLSQHVLHLIQQEAFTDSDTPLVQVVRKDNQHCAAKLPPIRCSFAFLDEPHLDLSQPSLQHLLSLSVIFLLQIEGFPGQLIPE